MTKPRNLAAIVAVLVLVVIGLVFFRGEMEAISVPPEPVFNLGGYRITNSMLASWLAIVVLVLLAAASTRNPRLIPSGLQNFSELLVEALLGICESVAGPRNARRFFPLVTTIFLYVLVNNWLGLVPGFNTWGCFIDPQGHVSPPLCSAASPVARNEGVGQRPETTAGPAAASAPEGQAEHFVPIFRSGATDLNLTLALALITMVMVQYYGVSTLGIHYFSKFFTLTGFPIGTFVGLLELVSEFAKVISFSFRLFGNIFAGHVLVAVIVFLVPWIAVIPFLGLEVFVGAIQAFVFAMLALVFSAMATIEHASEHSAAEEATEPAHVAGHGHAH